MVATEVLICEIMNKSLQQQQQAYCSEDDAYYFISQLCLLLDTES